MPDERIIQPEIAIINREGSELPPEERPANDKTREVQAYHDCAIFYLGKGDNLSAKPYGIILSDISSSPFSLLKSNLSLYMNGGMVSVYGRQVEVCPADGQSQIFIGDFTNETAFDNLYLNILLELNLNDITNQVARLIVSKRGAGYISQSELAPYQYNFYKNKTGVYRIPLVHCQYHPARSQSFDDFGFDCEIFKSETRNQAYEIREGGTIAGDKVTDLFNGTQFQGNALNNNISVYLNSNANKEGDNAKNVPGYSMATEAQKIGLGDNAVEVKEDLDPLLSINEQRINYLYGTTFGSFDYSQTVSLSYSMHLWDAYKVYLHFDLFELSASISYQYASSIYGQQAIFPASNCDVTIDPNLGGVFELLPETGSSEIVLYLYVLNYSTVYHGVPGSGYDVISKCTISLKQFKSGEDLPDYPLLKMTISDKQIVYEGIDGGITYDDLTRINWKKLSGLTLKSTAKGILNIQALYPAGVDLKED